MFTEWAHGEARYIDSDLFCVKVMNVAVKEINFFLSPETNKMYANRVDFYEREAEESFRRRIHYRVYPLRTKRTLCELSFIRTHYRYGNY